MNQQRADWWREFEPFVDQMVGHVARRYLGRVDAEELRQSGLLAVVEAGTRFDPAREATFAGYVRMRVAGAVRDAARRESLRKQRGQLERSFQSESQEKVALRRLSDEALDSALTPMEAARYTVAGEGGRASMESEILYRDFVRSLRDRLAELPETERRSVELCDLDEVPFAKAGEQLGYTGGGVFRVRKRALNRLRARF